MMSNKAPEGYLKCDGSIYEISEYKKLANHIKEEFGTYDYFGGNGSTTFAVPDLRGEFLRGTGTNNHTNQGSGANVGLHQDGTEINTLLTAKDQGNVTLSFQTPTTYENWYTNMKIDSQINIMSKNTWMFHNNVSTQTNSTTYGERFTSRPTNTSVLYCIKY